MSTEEKVLCMLAPCVFILKKIPQGLVGVAGKILKHSICLQHTLIRMVRATVRISVSHRQAGLLNGLLPAIGYPRNKFHLESEGNSTHRGQIMAQSHTAGQWQHKIANLEASIVITNVLPASQPYVYHSRFSESAINT